VNLQFPCHLQYTLSRRQRFVPLLRDWGVAYTPFVVLLFAFFCERTVSSILSLTWAGIAVFGGLALGLFLMLRGLFVGLLYVLLVPRRKMDLIIEEKAAGILIGEERWCMFFDGLLEIRKYTADVWTLRHWNGVVLHIPVDAITEELLAHIRAEMERGRTPEGMQAVIERGRRIEEIIRSHQ